MLTTVKMAAQELGISSDHVRRMIKLGQFPFYRLGLRAIRVDPEEIKSLGRLIAEGEEKQSSALSRGK